MDKQAMKNLLANHEPTGSYDPVIECECGWHEGPALENGQWKGGWMRWLQHIEEVIDQLPD